MPINPIRMYMDSQAAKKLAASLVTALKKVPRPGGIELDKHSPDAALSARALTLINRDHPELCIVKSARGMTLMRRADVASASGDLSNSLYAGGFIAAKGENLNDDLDTE